MTRRTAKPAALRHSSASTADERVARILSTVDAIPRGHVASYGVVAREAGLPGRARFVGRVLRDLPAGSKLPWHRVVSASGRPGLVGSAATEQRRRLAREGVLLDAHRRVPKDRFVASLG